MTSRCVGATALLSLVAGAVLALLGGWTGSAAAADPDIVLSSPTVALGGTVLVTLTGWNVGSVTVSLCGNEGRRGSVDCDLRGSQGAGSPGRPTERVLLPIDAPPAPCPCVVRVATATNDRFGVVPIVVQGVPERPVVAPAAAHPAMEVVATVRPRAQTVIEAIRGSLGGRVHRTLSLSLKNAGDAPATAVSISAAVGRDAQGGLPLVLPPVRPLRAGETANYDVPVVLAAPAFGHYVVFGSVYGPGGPVAFQATTANRPALLVVGSIALVADVCWMAVARSRRRRPRAEAGRGFVGPPSAFPVFRPTQQPVIMGQTPYEYLARTAFGQPAARSVVLVKTQVRLFGAKARGRRPLRSRPAMVLSIATVAVVLLMMTAGCSNGGGRREVGSAGADAPAGSSETSGAPTDSEAAAVPGRDKVGAPVPTSIKPAAGSPPTTALPVKVSVQGTSKVKDGQPVTLRVTADKGSEIFGFEARLCAGGATFKADPDMRPTQRGKCISKPLSGVSDDYKEVAGGPPYSAVESTFRVGVGTDTFSMGDGTPVTITCGPGHPCQIVLKVQYPYGFGFQSFPVTYA